MDKVGKIKNFTELAAVLDRYVIEDIKPDPYEMLDLVNTFWRLHEKLGKDVKEISHMDLELVTYMSEECDTINCEIDKQLYCVKIFQNFDLPETEHPKLDTLLPKFEKLAFWQREIINAVKDNIEILTKAGIGGKANSGCLSVIVLAIIVTSLTAICM